VDPVPDPLLLRKSGSARNRTRASGSVAKNSPNKTQTDKNVEDVSVSVSVSIPRGLCYKLMRSPLLSVRLYVPPLSLSSSVEERHTTRSSQNFLFVCSPSLGLGLLFSSAILHTTLARGSAYTQTPVPPRVGQDGSYVTSAVRRRCWSGRWQPREARSTSGYCGLQSGTGADFLEILLFPLPALIPLINDATIRGLKGLRD
jgi:hypothetical protein